MHRRQGGLTLVELLLVLAMVGVLASVALPAYNNYQDRIKQSLAIQDIRILQTLITNYVNDRGALPDSLAAVGNGGKKDPWGRNYVYVKLTGPTGIGMARKDRKLNPLNSDYDLYSMGKDGASKQQLTNKLSLDDIIRANDGAYVGLASKY